MQPTQGTPQSAQLPSPAALTTNPPTLQLSAGKHTSTMAEDRQPADIVEGATTGDVEDEVQPTAKSAEDRKAAAALSKLDARGDDEGAAREVDQEAVKNAMSALGGGAEKKDTKVVKVDAADVKLLVSLDATDLHAYLQWLSLGR